MGRFSVFLWHLRVSVSGVLSSCLGVALGRVLAVCCFLCERSCFVVVLIDTVQRSSYFDTRERICYVLKAVWANVLLTMCFACFLRLRSGLLGLILFARSSKELHWYILAPASMK